MYFCISVDNINFKHLFNGNFLLSKNTHVEKVYTDERVHEKCCFIINWKKTFVLIDGKRRFLQYSDSGKCFKNCIKKTRLQSEVRRQNYKLFKLCFNFSYYINCNNYIFCIEQVIYSPSFMQYESELFLYYYYDIRTNVLSDKNRQIKTYSVFS